MKSIEIFPWNEYFNTGIDEIDSQHRRLVELLNELTRQAALGADPALFDYVLVALSDYATYHFSTEESLWEKELPGSDELRAHKRAHDGFVEFIARHRAEAARGNFSPEQLIDFLVRWLVAHILEADRRLAYITIALRAGMALPAARMHADARMASGMHTVIQAILSTFDTLTSNTLELVRELSQRQQAQQALEDSQALLSATVDSTGSPIWSVGAQGFALLMFNEAIRKHFAEHHRVDLAQGMLPEQQFASAPGYADIWRAHYQKALDHGPYTIEYVTAYGGATLQLHFNLVRRNAKVVGVSVFGEDITARKAAESKARFLTLHDSLTRLPNRELVAGRFAVARSYADRVGGRVALLTLDLDQFKAVNDALGHRAGDELLRAVATRLGEALKVEDMLGRSGGDDFLIVLGRPDSPQMPAERASAILEALRDPFHIEGHDLRVTASMGVALYPGDGRDFDTLLQKADTALFVAKASGRDHFRFVDAASNAAAADALSMRAELAMALRRGEFELHYQPQVDLRDGTVLGAEALLRWRSPRRGLVAPGAFIHVAEDSGLIVPIGAWVLQQACRQAAAWQASGRALLVGVNLSALQFRRGDLLATVTEALRAAGLPPERLELELTESLLLEDTAQAREVMQQLKRHGVRFALDDFGTGYSNLSSLQRFPLDRLKIDQSFIRNIGSVAAEARIAQSIIDIGHARGLDVIAEGVEDDETAELLRAADCNHAQGYLFARPLPAEEFAAWMARCEGSGKNAA
jgi:diguanylate cyclase (GGDEF)-like protein/hemerythrin-like metal-binding protein